MATLKYVNIVSSAVKTYPIAAGNVIYCNDSKECFYDVNENLRGKITNIKFYTATSERLAESNKSDKYLYIVHEDGTFYRYDTVKAEWYAVSDSKQISDITGLFTSMNIATAVKNGIRYAPRTLAKAVYTEDGQTVEDKLSTISKVATTIEYVTATTDAQKVFTIPFPFDNYLSQGNSLLVYAGTVFIDNRRYSIDGNTLTLHDSEIGLELGRNLTFIFIYNTQVPNTDYFTTINGAYITDRSIPSKKLEKVSNSFALDDSTCVATSQALKSLNDTLNTKLDSINGLSILHAEVDNTTATINITADGFKLVDRSLIYLFVKKSVQANTTVNINNSGDIPIYRNFVDKVKIDEIAQNTELGLLYSADDNRFYITSGIQYELQTYITTYTTTSDNVSKFAPNVNHNPVIDKVDVYHNGIKLIRNINYIVDEEGNIILSGYTADKGDTICIEITKVIRSEMRATDGVTSDGTITTNTISTGTDKYSTADRAIADSDGNSIKNTYARKPIIFSTQMVTAGWSNSKYNIIDSRITENALILIGAPTTATSDEITTIGNAKLTCTNQASGSITLTAYGTVPTSDIIIQLAIIK